MLSLRQYEFSFSSLGLHGTGVRINFGKTGADQWREHPIFD